MKKVVSTRNYFKNLSTYRYHSLAPLLMDIFDTYQSQTKDLHDIKLLLEELGYDNLNQIPSDTFEEVRQLIETKREDWAKYNDSEYLTFSLLAAIQRKEVTVFIGDIVVQNIGEPIALQDSSIITFIDNTALTNITFKTL